VEASTLITGCGLIGKSPALGAGHHQSSNLCIPTKKGLFVQRLGCKFVALMMRVRFPHRPQKTRCEGNWKPTSLGLRK
jgi:hypothetical protein